MQHNTKLRRIQQLMINESLTEKNLGTFNNFDMSEFKTMYPPSDDSEKTKNELKYLSTIDLNKRFVQEKDDIEGNFTDFLNDKKIKYQKDKLHKIHADASKVILELKNYFKRPRPFRLNKSFQDRLTKSMDGFAYPSGHSTQSYLLCFILSYLYPKYKSDFEQITKDIVFSRQMGKAHYPSDISMGKKLAKKMFEYLKENDLI